MTRINTNVNSMIAQRVLGQQNQQLSTSLERLSTGLRINRGKDDPAGLIASENLRSEKKALEAAIGNAERADQVMNIAEGGLQEVNSLLREVQSLVGQTANDAGLSQEEREANQQQVDSILQTIDRIAATTSFQGTKLLNGTHDFTVSGQNSNVDGFQVNGAKLAHNENRDVNVTVTQSAQHAGLALSLGGGNLDLTNADSQFTFEINGPDGSRRFSFASGTSITEVAAQVNTFTDVTGVSATASSMQNTSGVVFKSTGFGSDEFVSIDVVDDGGQAGDVVQLSDNDENSLNTSDSTPVESTTNPVRDEGQDVGAIINGITANTDGRNASINTDFLNVDINLASGGAQNPQSIDAFTITGGGAEFNLGPGVNITNQVSIGITNVAARNLGSNANGFLNELAASQSANLVDGDLNKAQKIVDDAVSQVSSLRGRLGAFQKNTVGATIRSLNVTLENTAAAESQIRDTDFAKETAQLTRNQIMVQAANNALGIANNQGQSVLSLLG